MAPRKKKTPTVTPEGGLAENVYIADAGMVVDQPITETLENNYMPYAMSVIVSRAIPEIDGFKPSHRKLTIQWYVFLKAIKHFCTLMLTQKVTLVRHIHAICNVRLPVILRQNFPE